MNLISHSLDKRFNATFVGSGCTGLLLAVDFDFVEVWNNHGAPVFKRQGESLSSYVLHDCCMSHCIMETEMNLCNFPVR